MCLIIRLSVCIFYKLRQGNKIFSFSLPILREVLSERITCSLQRLDYSHALSLQHTLSTKTRSYNFICLGTLCILNIHPQVILDLRDAIVGRVTIYRQELNFWHDFSTYLFTTCTHHKPGCYATLRVEDL